MAIPLSYNLRNLLERKTTAIMTALGLGLTVAVLLAAFGLAAGLQETLQSSGDPGNILILRKGATSEIMSNLERSSYNDLKYKAGIDRLPSGEPLSSLEVVTVVTLDVAGQFEGVNFNVRGLTPLGIRMRPKLSLQSGRWFEPGRRELVVGAAVAARAPAARIGGKLNFGHADWEVVGIATAGQSAANSEILCDLNQIAAEQDRAETLSSVLVRASDPVSRAALINALTEDQRLNIVAMPETDYYDQQTTSAVPVLFAGICIAGIMSLGSSFAAMNTMYAAVARRSREIGTLRVLGFSRSAILASFLIESVLLAALGGLIGCCLVLPLNGATSAIGNFNTFSETSFQFRVTPLMMQAGVVFAVIMGAFGGLLPAINAARQEILVALKAI